MDWTKFGGLGESVDVKESMLKNAGKGVFALQSFRDRDVITSYAGKEMEITAAKNQWEKYQIQIGPNKVLVPSDRAVDYPQYGDPVGQLINHSVRLENVTFEIMDIKILQSENLPHKARKFVNRLKRSSKIVLVVAKKQITVGSELFADYGLNQYSDFYEESLTSFVGNHVITNHHNNN